MSGVFELLEFVALLHAMQRDLDELGPKVVARACEMVADEAKRELGTYDRDWPWLDHRHPVEC
jgi:hypothetical protein